MEIVLRIDENLVFYFIVLAVTGISFYRLFQYSWGLLNRIPPQPHTSKKTKKKKRKSNANQVVSNDNLVEDNSQPGRDNTVESPRLFPYESLVDATENFRTDLRAGIDYMGETFVAQMPGTDEVFIVRLLREPTNATVEKFVDQVLLLTRANHPNITHLVGYSFKNSNKVLVYEHPSQGSLVNHLHGEQICLDWKRRMRIALGVSRGLEYLQTISPPLMHLHIEPANIWLDEDFNPKLSASGVYTMYHFPHKPGSYATTGSYAYGVHDKRLTKEVRPYLEDETSKCEIVDPKLQGEFDKGEFNKEELYTALSIAEDCIEDLPSNRPLIGDLVTRMNHLCRM